MQKVIDGKKCNTDTAQLLGSTCCGCFGDPTGYEEKLYQSRSGTLFVHSIGGPDSPYPDENIRLYARNIDKELAKIANRHAKQNNRQVASGKIAAKSGKKAASAIKAPAKKAPAKRTCGCKAKPKTCKAK